MPRFILLSLSLLASFCVAAGDFLDQCSSFQKKIISQGEFYGFDPDLKFSGSISFSKNLSSDYTNISFGKKNLKIPFIGEKSIRLEPSFNSIVKKVDSGLVVVSFYEANTYTDVRSEFLRMKKGAAPLFEPPVFHDWLAYKGFEYNTGDLVCSEDESSAQKVIAYLSAKVVLASRESKVLRLEDFDVGLVQINSKKSVAVLVVLEGENTLELVFKANPGVDLFEWLGINKVGSK